MSAVHSHSRIPKKPCNGCTCSIGLLSRQQRNKTLFRQISSQNRKSIVATGDNSDQYSVSTTFLQCNSNKYVNTSKRLKELRKEMYKADKTLVCYVVPSEDEHFNEYTTFKEQRKSFISGFDGSAGVAVISNNLSNLNIESHPEGKALLSTDGRYFLQASQQLDFNWQLNKQGVDTLTWQQFCINECLENFNVFNLNKKEDEFVKMKIGIDPKLITYRDYENLTSVINKQGHSDKIEVISIDENLVDLIWPLFEESPERVLKPITYLDERYTGQSFHQKKRTILKDLGGDEKTTKFVISKLDEICWLLNLRGSDIEYNPVFFAYLIIDGEETILFTNNTIDDSTMAVLLKNKIQVQRYQRVWLHLQKMASSVTSKINVPQDASWGIIQHLNNGVNSDGESIINLVPSPIAYHKSIKNDVEISNAKLAQKKDAFALSQYFAWLENELVNKQRLIDEVKSAQELEQMRQNLPNYKGPSFETISSTGSNGSIIHYTPTKESCRMIDPNKPYLLDAGAQFLEGTTDVTRTIVLKKDIENIEELKRNYTLVLKGNLALERMVFPKDTITGDKLDIISRQFLWAYGLDYKHGTGHGIGAYLNVHEGPIGIRPNKVNDIKLAKGMLISNEPGYYKDGEYGIRIENDILIVEHPEYKDSLTFENLTLVPYCSSLIDKSLLTNVEIDQINSHHKRCWDILSLKTNPLSITFKWLKRETAPL